MKRKKRLLQITLLLLLLLVGLPAWLVYQEVRQQQLNRDLIAAIKRQDLGDIRLFLNRGVSPDAHDHPAFSLRGLLADKLSQLWGSRHARIQAGPPALQLAVDQENAVIVERLLKHGAKEVNVRVGEGWHPILWAAFRKHWDLVRMLVEKGADVNVAGVAWAGGNVLQLAAYQGRKDMVVFLLDHGADINVSEDGTLLMHAIWGRHENMVDLLLNRGADVHRSDQNWRTPILVAAGNGRLEIVKKLLAHGAKVDAQTKQGVIPLMTAVQWRHTAVVRLLLAHGADVNARDMFGHTVLDWNTLDITPKRGAKEMTALLKKAGAKEHKRQTRPPAQ